MLRRLSLGPFQMPAMVSLGELEQALEAGGCRHWMPCCCHPGRVLPTGRAWSLARMRVLSAPRAAGAGRRPAAGGELLVFEHGGGFLGLGIVDDEGRVAPRRLIRSPEAG